MDSSCCPVKLSAHPARGLMDEKMTFLVQNAPPGHRLTVHSLHQCEDGFKWEAYGHYVSDSLGTVNVSQDLSLGGTYSGVEPMGLLWSLRPVPGSRPGLRLRKMNIQTPMVFTVTVYQGHHTEGFADLAPLAAAEVERWYMAPGIRRIDVTEDGLTAAILLPPGPGPFPGVLDLWGAGGRLIEIRAALLASHGFASMALDYLTPKITKETGKMVSYDYIEKAYQVLEKHPQVIGNRIAVLGASLGSSIALKMAAYSEVIQPRCLVIISGSHVLKVDGTLEETWNYLFLADEKKRFNEKNELIFRDQMLPIPTDPQLKVEMGRIQCPLLAVLGEDDQMRAAYESVMDMKEMMERSGNSHLLTILKYPNTGHLIEPPYSLHLRASVHSGKSKGRGCEIVQLAAVSGGHSLNLYVLPRNRMQPSAARVTGFRVHSHRLYLHRQLVLTNSLREVLLSFIAFLQMMGRPLVVGHNIRRFDCPLLARALDKLELRTEFESSVSGCVDTLPLAREMLRGRGLTSFRQEHLVRELLGLDYKAHDALQDVRALQSLYNELQPTAEMVCRHRFSMDVVETRPAAEHTTAPSGGGSEGVKKEVHQVLK